MSSIAALAARRAFARQSLLQAPSRRFLSSSKVEEAGLDKGPKRDPELYVPSTISPLPRPHAYLTVPDPSRSHVRCLHDRWLVIIPLVYRALADFLHPQPNRSAHRNGQDADHFNFQTQVFRQQAHLRDL